jgi:hypothetical protein
MPTNGTQRNHENYDYPIERIFYDAPIERFKSHAVTSGRFKNLLLLVRQQRILSTVEIWLSHPKRKIRQLPLARW